MSDIIECCIYVGLYVLHIFICMVVCVVMCMVIIIIEFCILFPFPPSVKTILSDGFDYPFTSMKSSGNQIVVCICIIHDAFVN